jgi:methylase of polypeptide subunit release factors
MHMNRETPHQWDFHDLNSIEVTAPILIPRPETEELVDLVIDSCHILLRQRETFRKMDQGTNQEATTTTTSSSSSASSRLENRPIRILDIGTGSGVIGISILKSLNSIGKPNKTYRRGSSNGGLNNKAIVVGIEPNLVGHQLSIRNAAKFNVSNHYYNFHGTLADFLSVRESNHLPTKSSFVTTNSTLPTSATSSDNKSYHAVLPEMFGDFDPLNMAHQFDIIVSNPPYIPQQDELTLQPEVVKYEDPMALFGGEHGLDLIMDIVDAAPLLLLPSSHHGGGGGGDDVQKKKNDKSKGNEDNSHYANIWMEMDTSHPALLKQWLSSTTTTSSSSLLFSSSNNGDGLDTQQPSPPSDSTLSTDVVFKGKKAPNNVKFVNSHVDVFGNIRFCSLKV